MIEIELKCDCCGKVLASDFVFSKMRYTRLNESDKKLSIYVKQCPDDNLLNINTIYTEDSKEESLEKEVMPDA